MWRCSCQPAGLSVAQLIELPEPQVPELPGYQNGRKFRVAAGEPEKGDGRRWACQPKWTEVRMKSLDSIAERFGVRERETDVLTKKERVAGFDCV
jgi:hypothetical protein